MSFEITQTKYAKITRLKVAFGVQNAQAKIAEWSTELQPANPVGSLSIAVFLLPTGGLQRFPCRVA